MTHDDIRSLEIAVMFRSYSDSTDRITEAYEIASSLRRAQAREDRRLDGPRRAQVRRAQCEFYRRHGHLPAFKAKNVARATAWQKANRERHNANQRRLYAARKAAS